ncbi:MAG: reductive dehalogenase domain-containing protein [Candidatus Omnitrophota bacterium]
MDNKFNDYNKLKKYALDGGADLFGIADISSIKKDFLLSGNSLKKLDKAICLGARLSNAVLQEIIDAPNRLYFHHYKTVNAFLDQLALKVCNYIQKKGYLALPIPASQIVDWQNQLAHLSHRAVGVLAGLGWIGRNNLLITKELGSQFRLVTILTDMPLKVNEPVKDDCGKCRLCVEVCPAKAIKEHPGDFDFARCFEKLKEFQKARLVDQYICGVCVKACKGRI